MKQITFIGLIVLMTTSLLSYELGRLNSQQEEYQIIDKVSTRYTKVFGSPSTQEEQIIRDYIIYDEPLKYPDN